VYLVTDERPETAVDELVPGDRPEAFELSRYDQSTEMRVVVALDADDGIPENGGDPGFNLDGLHDALLALVALVALVAAQFTRLPPTAQPTYRIVYHTTLDTAHRPVGRACGGQRQFRAGVSLETR
jgi:hypothetical protein